MDEAVKNTDKELWRQVPDDYYSPSIHVTEKGSIGINVGGYVYVKPIEKWHRLAKQDYDTSQLPPRALAELCRTSLIGAKKHGEAWRSRSIEDIWSKYHRHMIAFVMDEEQYDKEDGQHHLAACIHALMCLLDKDLEDESAHEFASELDKMEANVSNEKLKEGDIYPDSECPTCGYEHCCPLCKGDLTYSKKSAHFCCSDCCSVCKKLEVKNENKS